MHKDNTYTIDAFVIDNDKSEIRTTVSIPNKELKYVVDNTIKQYGKQLKVDGFRKGSMPKKIVLKQIKPETIVDESVRIIIEKTYQKVLLEKKVVIIDSPAITIKEMPEYDSETDTIKVANVSDTDKNPNFSYTLTAPIQPVFTLEGYTKTAKEIFSTPLSVTVSEKEMDDAITETRRQHQYVTLVESGVSPQEAQTKAQKVKVEDLPVIDDKDTLEKLGKFKNYDALKARIKTTIQEEKKSKEMDKRRAKFVDSILKETTIYIPKVLISHEVDRLQAQLEDDLQRINSTLNAYLKDIKKTPEEFIEQNLKPQAERNARFQLVLNKIAETENLTPKQEDVEKETEHILQHMKNVSVDSARGYVTLQMRNALVFKFLESQK